MARRCGVPKILKAASKAFRRSHTAPSLRERYIYYFIARMGHMGAVKTQQERPFRMSRAALPAKRVPLSAKPIGVDNDQLISVFQHSAKLAYHTDGWSQTRLCDTTTQPCLQPSTPAKSELQNFCDTVQGKTKRLAMSRFLNPAAYY